MSEIIWEDDWKNEDSYFCEHFHHDGMKIGRYKGLRIELLRGGGQYSVDVLDEKNDCPMAWEPIRFDSDENAIYYFERVIKRQYAKLHKRGDDSMVVKIKYLKNAVQFLRSQEDPERPGITDDLLHAADHLEAQIKMYESGLMRLKFEDDKLPDITIDELIEVMKKEIGKWERALDSEESIKAREYKEWLAKQKDPKILK